VCGVPYDDPFPFGRWFDNYTVLEDTLACTGNERTVDQCGTKAGQCYELTQVMCQDCKKLMFDLLFVLIVLTATLSDNVISGVPTNLMQTEASSTTVTVEWTVCHTHLLLMYTNLILCVLKLMLRGLSLNLLKLSATIINST